MIYSLKVSKKFSIVILLITWQLFSIVYTETLFPSPLAVISQLYRLIISGTFVYHLLLTLTRVLAGFSVSIVLALTIGYLVAKSGNFGVQVDQLLAILMYIPSIVMIYLVIILAGLGAKTIFLTVILLLVPELTIVFSRAIKGLDHRYNEVAQIYKIPPRTVFFKIILPQLAPTIQGMVKLGLAVSWKLVILTEVFSQANGVGFKINESFSVFSITKVLAWLVGFILVISALEAVLIRPILKYLRIYSSKQ